MEVRQATGDDIEGVQRVARRAWTAAYEDIVGRAEIDACMREWYSREFLEERLDASDLGYFVAVTDKEVVGYASAGPRKGDSEGQLFTIYVDPDHWGEGVGTELLAAATDHLAMLGMERMRVEVFAENDVGNAFYQTHGFDCVDQREFELFTGETFQEYVYYRRIEPR